MFRQAFLFIALAFCFATSPLPVMAQAGPASANGPATTPICQAGNRNWSCGIPNTTPSGTPVTICVETVVGSTVTDRRDVTFPSQAAANYFFTTAPAGTSYQVCGTTPSCTQSTETRALPCPTGQTGQINEQRTVNVGGTCGVNSGWVETGRTCQIPPNNNCTLPWGGSIASGQSVVAWQSSSVAYGGTCIFETRVCTNGVLSGSFQFQSCTPTPPADCALPWGGTIAHGQSVTAFQTQSVPYGQVCASQTRTCNNGVLSGSYTFQTCNVTNEPKCNLPWGGQISIGQSVTAYQSQQSTPGGNCVSETRSCVSNGQGGATLTGTYQYQACVVVELPFCVTPWNTILGINQSVTAYRQVNGLCESETRTCVYNSTNNTASLSGTYTLQTCTPTQNCTLPWGGTLANGQSVTAYQTLTVPYGQVCVSQTRTCTNGVLSGSYTAQTCNVNPPSNCALPWGGTLAHGQSVTAYQSSAVGYGGTCHYETRTCNNGVLSGSFTYQSCTITPPQNCALPWGGTLAHGQSVVAYASAVVANGQVCQSETRYCNNGVLSGTYAFQNCTVQTTEVLLLNQYQYCTDRYAAIGLEYNPQLPYRVDVVLITGGQDGRLGKNCLNTGHTGRLKFAEIPLGGNTPDQFNVTVQFRAKIEGYSCSLTGAGVNGFMSRTVTLHVNKGAYSTTYIDHVVDQSGNVITGPAAATAVVTQIPCIPYADFFGLAGSGLFGQCPNNGQVKLPKYTIYANSPATIN